MEPSDETTAQPGQESLDAHRRAAASIRRLGHSLVAREVDTALLEQIAELLGELAQKVESTSGRSRLARHGERSRETPTIESPDEEKALFRESIISGDLNALGLDAQVWREGDAAVLETILGPAFEGAAGRSHGGIVAAMVDETMGVVLLTSGQPAVTGRLCVTYRAGTPVGTRVTCRAWMTGKEARKLFMAAEVHADGVLCAEAEAIFITVDPTALLGPAPEEVPKS